MSTSVEALFKKICDLLVGLVPRFWQADGYEDGADRAEARVEPECAVKAHRRYHGAVRGRQYEVDLAVKKVERFC